MPYTGSCACGAVTATIGGEPVAVRQCWCRQCQRLAAGSATTNAMFATADLVVRGELASTSYVAESGNTLTQSFCGACGTPVLGPPAVPHPAPGLSRRCAGTCAECRDLDRRGPRLGSHRSGAGDLPAPASGARAQGLIYPVWAPDPRKVTIAGSREL